MMAAAMAAEIRAIALRSSSVVWKGIGAGAIPCRMYPFKHFGDR
jgi:hypothetical protein